MKRLIFIFTLVFLTGCSTVPWVKPPTGEYKDGARRFKAQLPSNWMRYTMAKYFLMTKDGIVLDAVIVERHPIKQKLEFTKKKFTPEMLPQDIAEVEIDDNHSNPRMQMYETDGNIPLQISGQDGFKITYHYQTQSGLLKRGIHYGFKYDQYVYRIIFEAADQYYFAQCLPDFERFFDSFQLNY